MTNQEAREELADLADSLNLIPSTRKGQAMQMALDALKEQNTIAEIGQALRDVLGRFCETLSHMNLAEALQKAMEKQKETEALCRTCKNAEWDYNESGHFIDGCRKSYPVGSEENKWGEVIKCPEYKEAENES